MIFFVFFCLFYISVDTKVLLFIHSVLSTLMQFLYSCFSINSLAWIYINLNPINYIIIVMMHNIMRPPCEATIRTRFYAFSKTAFLAMQSNVIISCNSKTSSAKQFQNCWISWHIWSITVRRAQTRNFNFMLYLYMFMLQW